MTRQSVYRSWKNEAGSFKDGLKSSIIGPLLLMFALPIISLVWPCCHLGVTSLVSLAKHKGLMGLSLPMFHQIMSQCQIIVSFALFQVVLLFLVPGASFEGPVSPRGHKEMHRHNGFACFVVSIAVYFLMILSGLHEAGRVFRELGALLVVLNFASIVICVLLFFKGMFLPSPDTDRSGNFVLDFFWGTELHPRIFGINVKTFVVTRLGMIGWGILLLEYAAEHHRVFGNVADSMIVAVALQLVYIAKFFW